MNLRELEDRLNELPAKVEELQRQVASEAMQDGLSFYQNNVSVDSGELRDSADIEQSDGEVSIIVTAPHAIYDEARNGTLAQAFEVALDSVRAKGYK